eukprot:GAHX01001234.1.p1 GENE.GAHX01001234.1~~GAHX01001234.1.p1  ORF type:complete len:366 (+),score=54.53 GAHX01001234.1:355-1452(+)
MSVISIFMACFFVAMLICILILNSRIGNTDNNQKDPSNEKDKSSNVVNIEEQKAPSTNNKQHTIISNFINDTIRICTASFLKDEFYINRETKIAVNDNIMDLIENNQIMEQTGEIFMGIQSYIDTLLNKTNQENDPIAKKITDFFFLIYGLQEAINSYHRITRVNNNDRSQETDNLELYINYMILYEGLHGVSKVLNSVVKDNKKYREQVENNLKDMPEMDEFIAEYTQALKDSSTNVYKETEVNIPPFKDSNNDNIATIFLIQDFDKVTNFVMLTFYQILLYIFTYDAEKKEIHLSTEVINTAKNVSKKELESFNTEIKKVNTNCSELFKITIKKLGNHSLASNFAYRNCLRNINAWMMSLLKE